MLIKDLTELWICLFKFFKEMWSKYSGQNTFKHFVFFYSSPEISNLWIEKLYFDSTLLFESRNWIFLDGTITMKSDMQLSASWTDISTYSLCIFQVQNALAVRCIFPIRHMTISKLTLHCYIWKKTLQFFSFWLL